MSARRRILVQTFCIGSAWIAFLAWQAPRPRLPGIVIGSALQHERLQLENRYKNPEEVIRYYVNRDASGFIWSGLLDSERKAFTLWKEVPNHETFYIAKR